MRVIKTYAEIWQELKQAAKTLTKGFCRLTWAIILLPINIAITLYSVAQRGIKAAPMVAVGIALIAGIITSMGIYADSRYKIETLTFQRDQAELRMDSFLVSHGYKNAYRP